MRPLKQGELGVVLELEVVQKLQPQVFQLVRVSLEQFEVVANR